MWCAYPGGTPEPDVKILAPRGGRPPTEKPSPPPPPQRSRRAEPGTNPSLPCPPRSVGPLESSSDESPTLSTISLAGSSATHPPHARTRESENLPYRDQDPPRGPTSSPAGSSATVPSPKNSRARRSSVPRSRSSTRPHRLISRRQVPPRCL